VAQPRAREHEGRCTLFNGYKETGFGKAKAEFSVPALPAQRFGFTRRLEETPYEVQLQEALLGMLLMREAGVGTKATQGEAGGGLRLNRQ